MRLSIKNKKAEAEMTLDVLFGIIAGAIIVLALVAKAGAFSQQAERTDDIVSHEMTLHLNTLASLPYPSQLTTQTTAQIKPDGIYIDGKKTGTYNLQKATQMQHTPPQEILTLAYHYGELEIGGILEAAESIPKEITQDYELKISMDISVDAGQIKTYLNRYKEEKQNPDLILIITQAQQDAVKCYKLSGLCEKIRTDISQTEKTQYGYEQIQAQIPTIKIETTGFDNPVQIGIVIDKALREYYVG